MAKVAIDAREAFAAQPTGKGLWTRWLLEALAKMPVPFEIVPLLRSGQKRSYHLPFKARFFSLADSLWHLWLLIYLPFSDLSLFLAPTSAIIPALLLGKRSLFVFMDAAAWRYPQELSWKTRLLERFFTPLALKRALKIITISRFSQQELVRLFRVPRRKITIIYPASTLRASPARAARRVPTPYLLYLGTMEPRKNLINLLRAYRLASRERKMPGLVLAGKLGWRTGPLLKVIHTTPGVRFLGYVNEAEKAALLKRARAFVYPSLYEGFGIPPLEALVYKIPTLVSRAAALPEVVNRAALLCNPHNLTEMKEKLSRLSFDQTLRRELKSKARRQALRFSWQRSARRLISLIQSCLAKN